MAEKWKGAETAPIRNGVCTKHRERVTPLTGICLSCHHDALRAAGVEPESLTGLRAMGGATGFNRARLEV